MEPRAFGDWELLEEIGCGGMGVVYKARQKSLDRMVALKLLLFGPHAPPDSIKRFRAEAVATAALQHPNIVAIHEVGFCQEQHFIAMEYVEGQSLSALIRGGGPLTIGRAAQYLKKIAEAIHYAHERGILHRDLKPGNVLIDASDQPRVTDFGLAKRLDDSGLLGVDSELTLTGEVLGSPHYMAPEQAAGKRGVVSRRTDVYALGAILYHALTGRPPFLGEGLAEIVQQLLNLEPLSPRALNASVPADLETVCLKCLEKEPDRRYATAQLLAEELSRFLSGKPVLARPVGRLGKTWRWCRRSPALASLIAALVVVIAGGFAAVLSELRRAKTAELVAWKNAYVADMSLARQALDEGNLGRARTLLDRYRPRQSEGSNFKSPIQPDQSGQSKIENQKSKIDLRGWEWRWLWQRSQTHERATLTGASDGIGAIALSRDGHWLAGLTDAIRIWDLRSQRCVASRREPTWYGNRLVFAPDGRRLFVGHYEDACVKVLSVPALELLGELRHSCPVDAISLSWDGRLLAAADAKGVTIWDATEWRELSRISSDHDLRFGRVALSRDGRRIAFNDVAGNVYVWDWMSPRELAKLTGHTRVPPWQNVIQELAFTPDGRQLISSGADRTVRLWDVQSGRELGQLQGHSLVVRSLAFSDDGATLATASCDQTARLWDVATWQTRATLRGHLDEVWGVAFSSDADTLATSSKDATVKLWDAHPPPEPQTILPLSSETRAAALAADAGEIGLLQADGSFHLLDTTNWRDGLPRPVLISRTGTLRLAIDPRATCLVASTEAGPMRRWRLPDGTEEAGFVGHTGSLDTLVFSEDGQWLATAGQDHTVRLWRTKTRKQAAQFSQPHGWVMSIELSANGSLLGVVSNDNEIELWETASRRHIGTVLPKNGCKIIFLHHRSRFITGDNQGQLKVWDQNSLRCLSSFRGSLQGVGSLALTPDDRTLAAGTGEGAIKLWDVESGQELAVLKGHRQYVEHLAFSEDGRRLLSASPDAVCAWAAPSLQEIDATKNAKAEAHP